MARMFQRLTRWRDVAFVLSGGGNLGAMQVGMLKALAERGIVADHVLGCSVGALNGAAYATDPTVGGVAALEKAWIGLSDEELMPSGWIPRSVQLARKGDSLHDNEGLRALTESVIPARRFSELDVPFQCVATRIADAAEVWLSEGPLIPAVLASAALPAVYPAVEIDGHDHIDGGVVNDVPIARAVELGYRKIFILQVGNYDRPRPQPKRPLDVLVQSFWIARRHRFHRDLHNLPSSTRVHVLPTGDHPDVRYNDFSRTEHLIQHAYEATSARLDSTPPSEMWSDQVARPSLGQPAPAPESNASQTSETSS